MRQRLGKGLDALIPGASLDVTGTENTSPMHPTIPIDSIHPSRVQPRKQFNEETLSELAQSIRKSGITQPIVVTKGLNGEFEIIVGERRFRAAKLAGLTEIPVIVRENVSNQERLTLALIENVQREDLNPIEAARAYSILMTDFSLSQSHLSEVMGKSRPAIANTLRLLDLPERMQNEILNWNLSEGHGRALLMVNDSAAKALLFERALQQNLSVRDLEEAARKIEGRKKRTRHNYESPIEVRQLQDSLQQHLGTRVRIRCSKKGVGSVLIEFYSIEDLERLADCIKK